MCLTQDNGWNRERVRRVVDPARGARGKVQDISRMTGLSTQTPQTCMMDLMRPIPDVHLALGGPPPSTLEQSVLRTIGEEPPTHEWEADAVRARLPVGRPTRTADETDACPRTAGPMTHDLGWRERLPCCGAR